MSLLALAACSPGNPDANPYAASEYLPVGTPYGRVSDGRLPLRDFELRQLEARRDARTTRPAALPPAASSTASLTTPDSAAASSPAEAGPAASGAAQLAALPPEAAPAARTSAPLTLAQLKGLTPGELKATLGDPTLLRRDGPAQLWQYAGSGCVLHVFLYQDKGTDRVAYSEVRIDDPEIANPPTCVAGKRLSEVPPPNPVAAR